MCAIKGNRKKRGNITLYKMNTVYFVAMLMTFGLIFALACPAEAVSRYLISNDRRSFVSALIACKQGGMKLAIIESEDDQTELNNAIAASSSSSGDGYWLGAVAEKSGFNSWYWVDSGLRMMYKNWGSGQPQFNYEFENSYCVRQGNFYKADETNLWQNVNCNLELYYICQLH